MEFAMHTWHVALKRAGVGLKQSCVPERKEGPDEAHVTGNQCCVLVGIFRREERWLEKGMVEVMTFLRKPLD